ncbi:hypothetical protein Dimus_036572, partial [Dionaea muscipula]
MARGRGTRGTLSDPNIGENMARGRGTRGTLFDPNIGENMARGRGTRGRGGHTLPEDTLPTSPLPPATSHIPLVDSHVAPVTSPALVAASPVTQEEENNRPVALDEVYLNTHLKGGKFCSEKAKKVY